MFLTLRYEIGRASDAASPFDRAHPNIVVYFCVLRIIELSVFIKIVEIYARSQHPIPIIVPEPTLRLL